MNWALLLIIQAFFLGSISHASSVTDLSSSLKFLESPEVTTCAFGLTVPDEQKWPKKDIVVCWASPERQNESCSSMSYASTTKQPENAQAYKNHIKLTIEQEYSVEKTGIHFKGWKECSENEPYDVMLFMGSLPKALKGTLGEASIGPCKLVDKPGKKPYVFLGLGDFNTQFRISFKEDLAMTALHEFGHLAGLHHEHFNFPGKGEMHFPGIPMVRTSELDTQSVMNYDFNRLLQNNGTKFNQDKVRRIVDSNSNIVTLKSVSPYSEEVNVRIGLSDGDLNALKCLYVYKDQEKEKKCKVP